MARQHGAAERIGLALPDDPHSGAFEAEVQPADGMPENRLPTDSVSGIRIPLSGKRPVAPSLATVDIGDPMNA